MRSLLATFAAVAALLALPGAASADNVYPQTTITTEVPEYVSATSVALEWTADKPADRFECQVVKVGKSFDPNGWVTCTSPTTIDSQADGYYGLYVRGVNNWGPGQPTSKWFQVDRTAPEQVRIEADSSSDPLWNGSTPRFSLSADSEVARIDCSIDGGPWFTCRTNFSRWEIFTVPTPLADGYHALDARATDKAGNEQAVPSRRQFTVDTVVPVLRFVTPPPATTGSRASFDVAGSEAITHYECLIDGREEMSWACLTPRGLKPGRHTIEIYGWDQVGHRAASITHTWTVLAGPTVSKAKWLKPLRPAQVKRLVRECRSETRKLVKTCQAAARARALGAFRYSLDRAVPVSITVTPKARASRPFTVTATGKKGVNETSVGRALSHGKYTATITPENGEPVTVSFMVVV